MHRGLIQELADDDLQSAAPVNAPFLALTAF